MVLKQRAGTLSLVDADTSGAGLVKSRKSEWIYERSAHGNVAPVDSLWTCDLTLLSMRCLDYAQAKANLYECKFDYKMAVDSVPTVLIYSHTDDSVWWISCCVSSLSSVLHQASPLLFKLLYKDHCVPHHARCTQEYPTAPSGDCSTQEWRDLHSFDKDCMPMMVCWIKWGNMLKAS